MTKKQAERVIKIVRQNLSKEISDLAYGGKYAAGLASEGYSGGYRDALDDVMLLLNGVTPNRRHYWDSNNG